MEVGDWEGGERLWPEREGNEPDDSNRAPPSGGERGIGGRGRGRTRWEIDVANDGSREERWRYGFVGT